MVSQSPPFWLPSEGVTPVTTKLHDAVSSTHVLPQQVPPSQTLPQVPQFFGSLVVSTHEAPQCRWPVGQEPVSPPVSNVASPLAPASNAEYPCLELPHPPDAHATANAHPATHAADRATRILE